MLLYNIYNEEHNPPIDRAWFESSNILYAECWDKNNSGNIVYIVFNNGRKYRYDNVNVYDWLNFKMAESQGKEFNKNIRKCACEEVGSENVDEIRAEMKALMENEASYYLEMREESLVLKDKTGQELICVTPKDLDTVNDIAGIILAVTGEKVKVIEPKVKEDNE